MVQADQRKVFSIVSADLIQLIAQTGGTLGLAILALVMLRQSYQQLVKAERGSRERMREVNAQLLAAIERNTTAWVEATRTLTEVSAGLRVLLARRGDTAGGDV